MSTHVALAAATQDRKARLAQLKSLKRKQPDSSSYDEADGQRAEDGEPPIKISRSPSNDDSTAVAAPDVATLYLSGRNYDAANRAPKLGFEAAPDESAVTLEKQAEDIAAQTRAQAAAEAEASKPLDLFSLQPKKPNWDLKRDMAAKLKVLDVRTENAIARLIRERIEGQKAKALEAKKGNQGSRTGDGEGDGEEVGMDGATLVEAMHVREREEEEDARRENELDEELADPS